MGPINWLAIALSAVLATALGPLWYGPLFGQATPDESNRSLPTRLKARLAVVFVLQLLSATMLAHNFARIGAEKLAVKPWLYWMQTGGVAIAFIIPALWIGHTRHRLPRREALVDAGYWLVAYLLMGTVFWALS